MTETARVGLQRYDGAVLIGGASSRMGTDKAFVDFGGRPLLERPLSALAGAERRMLVGGRHEDVGEYEHGTQGALWLPDPEPPSGPLGGVIGALRSAEAPIVVVVSCDLPFIDRAAVEHLVAGVGAADGCVPIVEGHRQWMAAAWNRSILADLEVDHAAGERSLRRCAARLSIAWLFEDRPDRFRDVDTPEDLASALVSDTEEHTRYVVKVSAGSTNDHAQ